MNTHSLVQLPDEIINFILKKLNNCDVLYSLLGVNKRLDGIVTSPTFTRDLTLFKTFHDLLFQFDDKIVSRFCDDILPQINYKIEHLHLESSSMERILRATSYSNLHVLGLYNIEPEKAKDIFSRMIMRYKNKN